ncbi:MAG TPA: glycosyltransferase [Candidatus Dojkabacteria bacterium]|nr:glycosyltransferase [Candidatus Dojkabacteria bacterium]
MKRLALICNSHHKKSEAFDYIFEILSKWYKCDRLWDEEWNGGEGISPKDINVGNYDVLVFAQLFPKHKLLKKLKCKNIVWLPMFDSEVGKPKSKYLSLLVDKVKVFSFSRELFNTMKEFGLDVEYGQFFPKPMRMLNKNNNLLTVFYWPRVEVMSWDIVKKLLGNEFKGNVIIQDVPDPKNSFIRPSSEDIKKYNIRFIDYWMDFAENLKTRAECDIFIAPRLYEGIGLTFLESMASGVAVISPNNSTMNEYIKDGYNGYLYDTNSPKKVDLSNIRNVKANAYKSIKEGYYRWSNDMKVLYEVCERRYKNNASFTQNLFSKIYIFSGNFKNIIPKK